MKKLIVFSDVISDMLFTNDITFWDHPLSPRVTLSTVHGQVTSFKYCPFLIKNQNFPLKNQNMPLKNQNLPLKKQNLPLKNQNLLQIYRGILKFAPKRNTICHRFLFAPKINIALKLRGYLLNLLNVVSLCKDGFSYL